FLDQQRMVRRVREINQPLNAEGADKAYLKNRSQVSSMMSAGGSLNAQQKKLIEGAFAYKLFQMTDPTFAASPGDVRNLMTEVHRELNTAGKFQANPASLQRFREGVCEIVHPLLMQMMNNNLDARLFAIGLLSDLQLIQPTGNTGRTVLYDPVYKSLTDLLQNPQQPDAVRAFVAAEIREILGRVDVSPTQQIQLAMGLASELRRPYTAAAYQEELIEALSYVSAPREIVGAGAKSPVVLQVLAEVVSDRQRNLIVRCHAAFGLGRAGYDSGVNFEPLAWKVSQLAVEVAVQYNRSPRAPGWSQCGYHLFGAYKHLNADGLKGNNKQGMLNRAPGSTLANDAYQQVLKICAPIWFNPGRAIPTADLNAAAKWVNDNTPADLKWDAAAPALTK
ncbi:MAG: hypothetical protein KDA96_24245, partial [Planctomycetaceae bacterium]|nr:hypothetical protein [Planctomycetaceae bacterium]